MILGLETSTHSGGAALLQYEFGSETQASAAPARGETDHRYLEHSCSSPQAPAAPTREPGLVGSICFSTRELYSQRLLPSIEWLMTHAQVPMEQISVVGISLGPGSFTGLRIGLSVAKALAYASGAQIVGVGTLEALAVRASGGRDCTVCPLLDARHGQVYAGLYEVSWENALPRVAQLRPDWAGAVDDVSSWITGPTIFAGDALRLAEERLRPALGGNFRLAALHQRMPHPDEVALLTAVRAEAGLFDDPINLEPCYVRQSYTSARAGGAA